MGELLKPNPIPKKHRAGLNGNPASNGLSGEPAARPERREREGTAVVSIPKPRSLDRLPPHSIEAEQGLLGAVLLDPRTVMARIESRLRGNDDLFFDLRHQVIYEAIEYLCDEGVIVDMISLCNRLREQNQLEAVGGISYISALPDAVPSSANADYYVDILAEKQAQRTVIRTFTQKIGEIYDSSEKATKILDSAGKVISELSLKFNGQKILNTRDLVSECISEFDEMLTKKSIVTGISTGFSDLDMMTGGLKPAEYIILAARPSMGKTALAMNIVEHVAIDLEVPVGVFSLEMTGLALMKRLLCSRSQTNYRNLRIGKMAEDEYPRITNAAGKVSRSPIYIDDSSGLNAIEIRSRARRMAELYGIKLLVLDYLQIVKTENNGRFGNRDAELGRVSNMLKDLLKELNIPGLILAQLNRELDKEKKRKPRLSDLRECGSIEQDADTIAMLYKPKDEDEEDDQQAIPVSLRIAKQRNGPTGDVNLHFYKSFTRFESAPRIEE